MWFRPHHLGHITVIEAFESEALKLSDFYFTGDDYRYRFEPEARQRFIDLIRERFNSGVNYRGRTLKWDTIIEQKATELGRVLVNRTSTIDFAEPSPKLLRHDSRELRARILALTQSEARKLGIEKSTLHYLRKHATGSKVLRVHKPVAEKIMMRMAGAGRFLRGWMAQRGI